MLKLITGFALLAGLPMLSEKLLGLLGLRFPAALLGMVFLFLLLRFKAISEKWVEGACNFMLANMVILFVPILVEIAAYKELLLKNGVALFAAVFLSALVTIVCTGLAADFFVRRANAKRAFKEGASK